MSQARRIRVSVPKARMELDEDLIRMKREFVELSETHDRLVEYAQQLEAQIESQMAELKRREDAYEELWDAYSSLGHSYDELAKDYDHLADLRQADLIQYERNQDELIDAYDKLLEAYGVDRSSSRRDTARRESVMAEWTPEGGLRTGKLRVPKVSKATFTSTPTGFRIGFKF